MPTITISDECLNECLSALREREEFFHERAQAMVCGSVMQGSYEALAAQSKAARGELLKAQARSEG